MLVGTTFLILLLTLVKAEVPLCQGGPGLKNLWGDALTDSPDCIGPNGLPYPRF